MTATVDALHQSAGYVEVRTDAGQTYRADKVLLATGGFSSAKHYCPVRSRSQCTPAPSC